MIFLNGNNDEESESTGRSGALPVIVDEESESTGRSGALPVIVSMWSIGL